MRTNALNVTNVTTPTNETKERRTLYILRNLISWIALGTSLILSGCEKLPEDGKPHLLEDGWDMKLYIWVPRQTGQKIYVVTTPDWNTSAQWSVQEGKVTNTYNSASIKEKNADPSIKAWLALTPAQQEALGLPKSNDPKIASLLSLSADQRKNLWLDKDYSDLLISLKAKK